MVVRIKKRSRKYLGSRRWGVGNIKNARGKGDKGGTGKGGRKYKFTRIVVYEKERIRTKGFASLARRLEEINLSRIDKMAREKNSDSVDLKGYKVLGNGKLSKAITVKATKFSKRAEERIKQAGGKIEKFE